MKKILVSLAFLFAACLSIFAAATGEILQIPADPKAGFQWSYLIYLPKNMDTSRPLPLLFTMNDNGLYRTQEENEKSVLKRFEKGGYYEWGVADGVGLPMVMPMVLRERPTTDKPQLLNSHDLNRAVFVLKDGPYARLDLQVLAMLKDARKQLKKRGLRTQKKFLIAGFSSAGSFGDKLAFLHPKNVLAVATGGEHYPLLPLEIYHNIPLIFPVGAYDMKTYTGKRFHKKAWHKVPMFLTAGGDDYNDPLPYDDVYGAEDRATTVQVFGEGSVQDRWQKAREILAQEAPNVQTHTYPRLGHEWETQDIVAFLNAHKNGGPLKPITPTDTSDRPSKLPIHVSRLYWGEEAKKVLSPEQYQYLRDNELQLYAKGFDSIPFWAHYITVCKFDVLYKGKTVLTKTCPVGLFTEEDFEMQTIRFSDEDMEILKKSGGKTFSLRSHYPKIWDVPENLTFTIK